MESDLEFVINAAGPFRTLPTASTLFGQLVWAAAFAGLDVDALLEPYRNGQPSFLLSDAFPCGQFPKPILKPTNTPLDTIRRKALKNSVYFPEADWRRALEHGEMALVDSVQREPEAMSAVSHLTRVGIDRQTLMAKDGLLYSEATQFLRNTWSIFVRPLNDSWTHWNLRTRLEEVGRSGFGGGASVGRGAFEVLEERNANLPMVQGADGFTSLSAFVPKGLQPEHGYYDLEVYRGRLGGGYNGPEPWKRPYVRAKTGSSFQGPASGVYGMWVDGLATLENGAKVGDYAFAYPVGVKL
jgi:CRISPR type III-A-associated RAMP protein Csm4